MTKALIDAEGTYLGSYPDDAPPPDPGARFAPSTPDDARARWTGTAWVHPPDPALALAAGAARRPRQYRKALRNDPLQALVQRAKEDNR